MNVALVDLLLRGYDHGRAVPFGLPENETDPQPFPVHGEDLPGLEPDHLLGFPLLAGGDAKRPENGLMPR
jgi:hypothetical protein